MLALVIVKRQGQDVTEALLRGPRYRGLGNGGEDDLPEVRGGGGDKAKPCKPEGQEDEGATERQGGRGRADV